MKVSASSFTLKRQIVWFGADNLTPDPMYSHDIAFKPGHITTVEPGYYKEGEWGIRIESVLLCKQVEVKSSILVSQM